MRRLLPILLLPLLAGCANIINAVSESANSSPSGEQLMEEEKWQAALKCFDDELAQNPKDAEALANRAWCYARLGHYDLALSDASKAEEIDPKLAAGWDSSGGTYRLMSEYPKAIDSYNHELAIDPNSTSALIARGDCYSALHDQDRALADYAKAISNGDDDESAYMSRGQAYFARGEYKKAIEDYEAALRSNESNSDAYFSKGIAFMRLGIYPQALKDLEKCVELDPSSESARDYRAVVYLMSGDPAGAVKECRTARERANAVDLLWHDLYLYLAYKRSNKNSEADAALADAKERSTSGAWPYPIVLFVSGEIGEKQFEQLAVSADETTQARTWIALDKRLRGDKSADADFHWVVDKGEVNNSEYELALFALKHPEFPKTNSKI